MKRPMLLLPLLLLMLAPAASGADAGGARARTPAAPAAPPVQSASASTAKVERLIGESGYTSKKVSDDVWLISRQGKSLPEFQIIVTSGPGFWLAGVIVAEKKTMRVTPELMFKLLQLN